MDHIDNNPSNNAPDNLRWATKREQVRHSYDSNKGRKSNAPKRSKPIKGRPLRLNSDGEKEEWVKYPSRGAAARALNLDSGAISACLNGKIKQTGGYEFKFGEPKEPWLLEGEIWRDVVME